MIEKLDKNRKVFQSEEQVDNEIMDKIENIVMLLGQVQKGIETKQKCSLGMKLKMKVDPNRRYFKPKGELEDRLPYTSRSSKY